MENKPEENKEIPMIVFFTSSHCTGCVRFRGDGRPSETSQWKPSSIRKYLLTTDPKDKSLKLRALRLININDGVFGADPRNIEEFTMYHMIPSSLRINFDFINDLMKDPTKFIGTSILRINIRKAPNLSIIFEVEIDGNENDPRCEDIKFLLEEHYFWSFIPKEFDDLRDHFYSNFNGSSFNNKLENKNIKEYLNQKVEQSKLLKLEDIVTEELREDKIFDVLRKEYQIYCNNPSKYENIIKLRFDYNWFIDTFFPKRLRELEIAYPSWMLILPVEWQKGLLSLDPIYAKVACLTTELTKTGYQSRRVSNSETIEDLLIQYYAGRLSLLPKSETKTVTFKL